MTWIVIPNWDRFQHYHDRDPPWIKLYTRLLHDDDFQNLSAADRSALVGLWMVYAMTGQRVREDTSKISRAIGQRVTKATLERLNHAGFIAFSASKPLAKCSTETETETETPISPNGEPPKPKPRNRYEPKPASAAYHKFDEGLEKITPDLDLLAAARESSKAWEPDHA